MTPERDIPLPNPKMSSLQGFRQILSWASDQDADQIEDAVKYLYDMCEGYLDTLLEDITPEELLSCGITKTPVRARTIMRRLKEAGSDPNIKAEALSHYVP